MVDDTCYKFAFGTALKMKQVAKDLYHMGDAGHFSNDSRHREVEFKQERGYREEDLQLLKEMIQNAQSYGCLGSGMYSTLNRAVDDSDKILATTTSDNAYESFRPLESVLRIISGDNDITVGE